MRSRFSTSARSELKSAARYYEDRRPELGVRFLAAVHHARRMIEAHPSLGSIVPDDQTDLRRLRVLGFPYWLVYEVTAQRIVILVVAHTSRDPEYWVP